QAGNRENSRAIDFYTRRLVVTRVPGAAQHEVVRCRPGTVTERVLGGPGSAMHHSLTLALHRVRDTRIPSDVLVPYSLFKQPISFPRRIFAPGGCNFASLTRIEGWAERRSATRTSSRRLRLPHATSRA